MNTVDFLTQQHLLTQEQLFYLFKLTGFYSQCLDALKASKNGFEYVPLDLAASMFTLLERFKNITIDPSSSAFTKDSLQLLAYAIWDKSQNLIISDLDNLIYIILMVRFINLSFRYNILSAFLITLISIGATFLWYRHFIKIISYYERMLFYVPFFKSLSFDVGRMKRNHRMQQDAPEYSNRPFHIIKTAWRIGSLSEEGYRMDPISMLVRLFIDKCEEFKHKVIFLQGCIEWTRKVYYTFVRVIIPISIQLSAAFYKELGYLVAYTYSIRSGKKYCPYFIRWHWTCLLIFQFAESYYLKTLWRFYYYMTQRLEPELANLSKQVFYTYGSTNSLAMQNELVKHPVYIEAFMIKHMMIGFVALHVIFLAYAVLHTIAGQYFYIPILTDNVELNIGPRNKKSIYSGGLTDWQDARAEDRNLNRAFPQLWYGWFGRGTENKWNIFTLTFMIILWITKKTIKLLRLNQLLLLIIYFFDRITFLMVTLVDLISNLFWNLLTLRFLSKSDNNKSDQNSSD